METAVVKAGAAEGGLIDLILGSMKRNSKQYTMFLALLAIWVIFSFVTDRVFLTPRNLSNLFVATCPPSSPRPTGRSTTPACTSRLR